MCIFLFQFNDNIRDKNRVHTYMDNLQYFKVSKYNKKKYGEVNTDFKLIEIMLDIIPKEVFINPTLRWLDPAAGCGYFSISLVKRLLSSLVPPFNNKAHILKNMLYMIEYNTEHISTLQNIFDINANIIENDFLLYKPSKLFDVIIGNPPYCVEGIKKVPTNNKISKRLDGRTIWPNFIKHSVSLLKEGGYLLMIIPSIWMKPDKAKMYDYMLQYNLKKIRCFSNTETKSWFHGQAQTPTCFFLLQKAPSPNITSLYDNHLKRFLPYFLIPNKPIPVFGVSVFSKLASYVHLVGSMTCIKKTNACLPTTFLSNEYSSKTPYKNIRTCILNKTQPMLVYEYSDIPLPFHNIPKLILAHKMYGFPYYDSEGCYGVSRRDNYVLTNQTEEDFKRWHNFLSTKFALYLFEGTRYRMKYLEKYVFELIPDITKLEDFPIIINDITIANYFQLTDLERNAIDALHSKQYGSIKLNVS